MKTLLIGLMMVCGSVSWADEPRRDSEESDTLAAAYEALMTEMVNDALSASVAADRQSESAPASSEDETGDDQAAEIDSSELNLSGGDVMVEVIGDTIIITGIEDDLDTLENFVRRLDVEAVEKALQIVFLEKKDAKEVASRLQQALTAMTDNSRKKRPEDRVDVFAVSNNLLIISAPKTKMDMAVEMARQLDVAPERLPDKDPMLFTVKHRKAAEAAQKLKEIIDSMRKVQGAAPGEKYDVLPNDADNTILVIGLETSEREKIQQLLDAIDVEAAEGYGAIKLVLFPLLNADADALSKVLTDMISTPEGRKQVVETIRKLTFVKQMPDGRKIEIEPIDLEKPLKVLADQGTNSLIVATVDDNITPIGEIIKLLDDVPAAVEMGLRIFPLKYADAEGVATLLKDIFKEGQSLTKRPDGKASGAVGEGPIGEAFGYEVNIVADVRTNVLFAAGRPEQMAVAQSIVAEIDVPANASKFPLRLLFAGDNLDAGRVGQVINELFEKRLEALKQQKAGPSAVERERVFLAVDARTNALIVSASDENFDEIKQIVKELDVAPDALIDQIRIITCTNTSAADLQSKIEELWKRKADLLLEGAAKPDMPVIVSDARSNSLVIASTIEDFKAIQRLVETLESQELAPIAGIRLLPLEHNDAQQVADMLQQLFDERMKQRLAEGQRENPSDRVALAVDEPTNTILVASSDANYDEMKALIEKIDAQRSQFKIYTLQFASAAKLAARMQEMFDEREAAGGKGTGMKITLQADEGSNSLIASASPEEHAQVEQLLELLDKPSTIAQQFKIFPLKAATADALAERLNALFQAGSSAGGGSEQAVAIAVEPEPRSNSLIVWASPTEMENISEIIERLDTAQPTREMAVRVIRLNQALAEDFAKMLDTTLGGGEGGGKDGQEAVILSFQKVNDDGTKELRKLVRQDITITPDPYTNSIMVMAPADSMEMLESMIVEFDKIRPQTAELRLFPLVNADAEEMVKQLEEIYGETQNAAGELERQLVFGDSGAVSLTGESGGRQELRFSADRRTNTVLAAGSPVDLGMVESLIRQLDGQDIEDRVTLVHRVGYEEAQDLTQAIEQFNQAETDRLGDLNDELSAQRQAERAVTVVSVGDENAGSMIVGVSPRYYEQYMDLIYQIDRPEPQVMIQALIAEVTINDSVDLGLEFALQDLLFSEQAAQGPNGTIRGPDFDFVGGTDLGAGNIGGGFSFATTGEDFNLLLRALQTNSKVEVLSRPTIMVRNNEEAEIIVGDRVPTVSGTQINPQGSTSSNVVYNDIGIQLRVQPTINPDGYVSMEVEPEISAQTASSIQLTEGLSAPVFRERSANTFVTVKDGETVVIGGLITDSKEEGEAKVPILGDLPLIGALFRSTSNTITKTELLIVLTVDVIWTEEDARASSLKHRDMGHLPDWMKQHPMMEGLRILPEEEGFGPVDLEEQTHPAIKPTEPDRSLYGPKPGQYGPALPKPVQVSQASYTEERRVYGPVPPRK